MADLEVGYSQLDAASSYTLVRSDVTYVAIESSADYSDLTAAEVLLDYDTKNRYFSGDEVTFADVASLTAGKNFTDSAGTFTDALQSIDSGKGVVDEFSVGDFAYVLLILQRQFTDSVGFSDAIGLTANKVFSDTIVMDDFANVGARTIDTIGSKSNALSFSDTQTFSTGKNLFESPVVTDIYSSVFVTSRADTLSVTESISVTNRSLVPSILNARAINTATLNN